MPTCDSLRGAMRFAFHPAQHSTAQHSTAQHSTAQRSPLRSKECCAPLTAACPLCSVSVLLASSTAAYQHCCSPLCSTSALYASCNAAYPMWYWSSVGCMPHSPLSNPNAIAAFCHVSNCIHSKPSLAGSHGAAAIKLLIIPVCLLCTCSC